MAIGVKYIVAANFDEKGKAEVNAMVEDLRVSFKQLLSDASWMDNETKSTAQEKADQMRSFMAYPDVRSTMSNVSAPWILIENHIPCA